MPTRAPVHRPHGSTAKQQQRQSDRRRGSASARGYDRRWRKYTRTFLACNPCCIECQRQGRLAAAAVVDHIVPHRGDDELFWNQENHQALCVPCHNAKTGKGE